jgi:hypothetical protein
MKLKGLKGSIQILYLEQSSLNLITSSQLSLRKKMCKQLTKNVKVVLRFREITSLAGIKARSKPQQHLLIIIMELLWSV